MKITLMKSLPYLVPTPGKRPVKAVAGVTLIELMVAVSILAILLTIGIPSFRSFIQDNRRATLTNELLASFQFARSEMSLRGAVVSVCASANGTACGTTTDWSKGWIVFVDTDSDGAVDAGETILRYSQNMNQGNTVKSGTASFLFRPFNRQSTNATLAICDDRGNSHARWLAVSPAGRAHVETSGSVSCG